MPTCGTLTHQTPRAVSVIQSVLRDCALPGRISVVDLPSCFATWQGGELPGRRLFLDYCHLSAEGIRVAMAATALEVADLLDAGRTRPGIESLMEEIPPPSPYTEATAHFAAALQSSHEGQPASFVSYLCQEAVRRSTEVAQGDAGVPGGSGTPRSHLGLHGVREALPQRATFPATLYPAQSQALRGGAPAGDRRGIGK